MPIIPRKGKDNSSTIHGRKRGQIRLCAVDARPMTNDGAARRASAPVDSDLR
jgi:hypothetical protein